MTAINALGPVFLLVLMGIALRRINMPGPDFWPMAERITYFVFFPCLLVRTLAKAQFSAQELVQVFLAALVLLIVLAVSIWLIASRLQLAAASFTSVFQGAIRFNTYVGLAAASSLWGSEGLATTAIVVAAMVPLVKLLSIGIFAIKVGSDTSFVKHVAVNPLIIACLMGIALNLSGLGLPGWSDSLLEILSRPALPLGLLAIGVSLTYSGVRDSVTSLITTTTFKLIAAPMIALCICLVMGVASPYREAVVLMAALPTAPSAYILARQLNGDAPLMATITTLQTGIAFVTLPLVLWLLSA